MGATIQLTLFQRNNAAFVAEVMNGKIPLPEKKIQMSQSGMNL